MLRKFITLTIFLLCLFFGGVFYIFTTDWFDFSLLDNYNPGAPSIILDANGKEISRFELDIRKPISFDKIPDILVKAFVAAEDHNFFSHIGVSTKGILRSLLVNLYHMRSVQGASTITQQVIRLLFVGNEKVLIRKIKEGLLSLAIERKLTKEQIFELYINNLYFGRGTYGVEAACQRFWGKEAKDINAEEAAVLAAVAKSAWYYSPLNAPLSARKRRNVILRSMHNLGFITKEQFEKSRKTNLDLKGSIPGNPIRLYIQEWIRMWAETQWGRDALYKNGLRIKTTIDLNIQAKAEKAYAPIIKQLRRRYGDSLNGGLVSLDVRTGKVRASVAGLDFNQSQYNRSFKAVRQVGSVFKPIVYSEAIRQGQTFDVLSVDEPIEMDTGGSSIWKPKNWNRKFLGEMTLLKSLHISNNSITIKTFLEVGAEAVIKLAKKFGIYRNLKPYPSLALGIAEATVEEMAAAFNVFANDGCYVKPYLIESVKDQWGKKLYVHTSERHKVLDSITNSQMVSALSVFMKRRQKFYPEGSALNSEATGKSGSTNESSSNWYVGSTPELTTAVYLGRDDNKPMGREVFSSQTSFPIWFNFHKSVSCKNKHFYSDPSLREYFIDWTTGTTTDKLNSIDTVPILKKL